MQPRIIVGRRKTAVARVKIVEGSGKILVNNKELGKYFPLEVQREEIIKPLKITNTLGKYDICARVNGGGTSGQVEAVRLAIARSLVALDEELRLTLRRAGLLTRDSRMVERKKYGRRKARRRFQFSKR